MGEAGHAGWEVVRSWYAHTPVHGRLLRWHGNKESEQTFYFPRCLSRPAELCGNGGDRPQLPRSHQGPAKCAFAATMAASTAAGLPAICLQLLRYSYQLNAACNPTAHASRLTRTRSHRRRRYWLRECGQGERGGGATVSSARMVLVQKALRKVPRYLSGAATSCRLQLLSRPDWAPCSLPPCNSLCRSSVPCAATRRPGLRAS